MACRRWPVTIPECSASGGAEESQFPAGRCVRARRLTRPSYHRFWREMDNSWSVWAARFPLVADTTTYHRHSQSFWTAKFAHTLDVSSCNISFGLLVAQNEIQYLLSDYIISVGSTGIKSGRCATKFEVIRNLGCREGALTCGGLVANVFMQDGSSSP